MKAKTKGISLIILGIMMVGFTGINAAKSTSPDAMNFYDIENKSNSFKRWSCVIGAMIIAGGSALIIRNKSITTVHAGT